MAHFRGYVEGGRGEASRLGTKSSGITVVAQSWEGQIRVTLHEQDGEDWATVTVGPNPGMYGDTLPKRMLAHGPIASLRGK